MYAEDIATWTAAVATWESELAAAAAEVERRRAAQAAVGDEMRAA